MLTIRQKGQAPLCAGLHGLIIAISYDQRMHEIRSSRWRLLPVLLLLVLYWPCHGGAGRGLRRRLMLTIRQKGQAPLCAGLHGLIIAISYDQRMHEIRSSRWLLLPVLYLLVLYWPGLTTWFYQDDFGWLNLRPDVHSARDLAGALLSPKAHGNLRPLGENAYWLGLGAIFGVE